MRGIFSFLYPLDPTTKTFCGQAADVYVRPFEI
jgi:hypothetical protein